MARAAAASPALGARKRAEAPKTRQAASRGERSSAPLFALVLLLLVPLLGLLLMRHHPHLLPPALRGATASAATRADVPISPIIAEGAKRIQVDAARVVRNVSFCRGASGERRRRQRDARARKQRARKPDPISPALSTTKTNTQTTTNSSSTSPSTRTTQIQPSPALFSPLQTSPPVSSSSASWPRKQRSLCARTL